MCRLLGAASARPTSLEYTLCRAAHSLQQQSWRDGWGVSHADGWGLGWRDQRDQARVIKAPEWAAQSRSYTRAASLVESDLLLAHVRRATTGRRDLDHTHPFQRGGWLLAQNGGLGQLWHDRIAARIGHPIRGTTSAEHLLAWLCAHVGDERDAVQELGVIDALRELASRLAGILAANFILLTTDRLYAFRFAAGEYHTLYWTRRRRTVLVASEPTTTDEEWSPIPNGSLLVVERGTLHATLERIARPLSANSAAVARWTTAAPAAGHPSSWGSWRPVSSAAWRDEAAGDWGASPDAGDEQDNPAPFGYEQRALEL